MNSSLPPDLPKRVLLHGDRILSRNIVRFDSFWHRFRGLMLRPHLLPDEGVVIGHCNNIHTCFCRFPFDAAFLDAEGRILKTVHGIRPWRISIAWKAHEVLEIHHGFLRAHSLRQGDILTLAPAPPSS